MKFPYGISDFKKIASQSFSRHGNLRLRKYAVVSLGFERICRTEVRDR